MTLEDPSDKRERLAKFREKIRGLSTEELIALRSIMKRTTDELTEELKVLAERLEQHRPGGRAKPQI